MTTKTYQEEPKPKFDPNKPSAPVEEKPPFDPDAAFEEVKKKAGSIAFPESGSEIPSTSKTANDIINLAREYSDIGGKIKILEQPVYTPGGGSLPKKIPSSLPERQKAIDDEIKAAGFDSKEVLKEFADFPANARGVDIPQLLQEKKDNPLSFSRHKSAYKWQTPLFEKIRQAEGENAEPIIQNLLSRQAGGAYGVKRLAAKNTVAAIRNYVDDKDEQEKLIREFSNDRAFSYGMDTEEKWQEIQNDPRYLGGQGLNKYQIQALHFLEDTDPEKYTVFDRLMSASKEGQGQDFMRGYEQKARELERMGMHLEGKAIEEQMTDLIAKKKKGEVSPEDLDNYAQMYEQWETLQSDMKNQNERFPNIAAIDADVLAQEALGQRNGSIKRGVLGIGENVNDAMNFMGDLLQSPFRSKDQRIIDDLEDLGEKKFIQDVQRYKSADNQLISPEFIPEIDESLKAKEGSLDERLAKTRQNILSNFDKVDWKKNPDAGKFNFTSGAVFNSISDVASEVLSNIGIAATTGGFGNISKLRQLSTLFGSTFAVAYNDYYTQAIENNIPNPTTYATTHTAIEAASELLNNDIDMAKKLVNPRSTFGKIVNNVSKEEWDQIAKTSKGRFSKLLSATAETGKAATKNAFRETYEEVTGQLGGNIADIAAFNQDIDLADGMKSTIVNTLIGTLPLGFVGLPGQISQLNRSQKYALYEAAQNKEKYLERLDEDVQNGLVDKRKADQVRVIIDNAAKSLDNLSKQNTINIEQTDNEKSDLLADEILEGSISEDQKKAETELQKAEGKRNKLIEKGHTAIDKLLEEKDDNEHFVFKGLYRDLAKKDPLGFLEDIAGQIHGVRRKEGDKVESDQILSDLEHKLIKKYGADVVNVAKELFPYQEPITSKISVQTPTEIEYARRKVTTIAPKEIKADETAKELQQPVPEGISGNTETNEQAKTSETTDATPSVGAEAIVEEGTPPVTPPPKSGGIHVERPDTELSHRGLQNVANEFSLDPVKTRDRKTDIELRQEARETIGKWVADKEYSGKVEGLVKKAEDGDILTDKERVILEQHLANLSGEIRDINKNSPEFDKKLAEIKRLKEAGEKTRSEAGAALRIPTFRSRPQDLADYYVAEMEAAGVEKLTDQQKTKVEKEFNEISEIEKKYEEKLQVLRDENTRLRAEAEIKSVVSKTKREKKDFTAERKQIFADISEKLKKARGQSQATILPYANELIAIAPDVAKLVKSYAEQGITELAEMVKKVHEDLKPVIEQITENDVRDLIAGDYNKKRPTRNDLAAKLRDLRDEAVLIKKLEALENGEIPKSEKRNIERNRQITELRGKIKGLRKEMEDAEKADNADPKVERTPEEKVLDRKKRNIQKQIDEIEAQIKSGDFAEPEKKPEIKLDKETKELQDRLIKVKYEREVRIMKQEYEKSSTWNKIKTEAANVLNVPRTLMASVDFSAPLRQAFVATISHPKLASQAAGKMFQAAFSQKEYDRWFDNLKKSDRYDLMQDSKLALTDSKNAQLDAKEEQYMSNLVHKFPIVGQLVKGSERAYAMYLNKMRVDVFNRFTDEMQKNGKTWENSPDAYKQMAAYVNNITGRGSLGETLNKAAPILNSVFFSPRLMASRVNTLTYLAQPRFYKEVPAEVRKAYFKDMASTAALGLMVLGLAKLAGAETEDDPRSPDFGKIKSGNTRWDIWGGHQQYIRVAAQLISGKTKSSTSGTIRDLGSDKPFGKTRGDVALGFFRGKLAPVPALTTDIVSGRNIIGEKLTTNWKSDPANKEIGIGENLWTHLFPLTVTGLEEAMKDQGTKAMFTVGVPSVFGVGVNTYGKK